MKRLALALALVATSGSAWAQVPAGNEFIVNTYRTGVQDFPNTANTPRGDFVVVWTDDSGADGDDTSARGQRFDRAGTPLGGEFQANTHTTGLQSLFGDVSVGMDPRGGFVVTWQSYDQVAPYSGFDVFGQRYQPGGQPAGGEFQVNTVTAGDQGGFLSFGDGAVATARDGSFVVVWSSYQDDVSYRDVRGQRFDAAGAPIGGEFEINTATSGYQTLPDVAMDAAGNFVVVWATYGDGGTDTFGIAGQRYAADGTVRGGEFAVNTYTTGAQGHFYGFEPSVAVAPEGHFVVAWDGSGPGDVDGSFARMFDGTGAPVGAEFIVNTYTTGTQYLPDAGIDHLGNFVVAWRDSSQEGAGATGYGIFGQRFRADGTPRGGEFHVNTYTTSVQDSPSLSVDAVGNFLVSWSGGLPGGTSNEILVRRFGGLAPWALRVDIARNGVIEPGETFDVRPSWENFSGATLTGLGGVLANPAGPGAPAITDGTAAYPDVANGAATECTGSDCYAMSVSGTRPAFHWDVTADETITPDAQGQAKRWTLHVGASFSDVSTTSGFYRFIETMLHHSVTGGCAAGLYCPANTTTRREMAVFVLAAKEGPGYAPPACVTPPFNDVPITSGFCPFIAELSRRGVVGGCGDGNYCPASPVTRQEMAIFALATLDPTFVPPACTVPPFLDVPITSGFCPYIAELSRRGVVGGCGGGNYCPAGLVTRQEMAVFIAGTFSLALYGI
jgi:hypothetical protein